MSEECWNCYYFGQCGRDDPCDYYDCADEDEEISLMIEQGRASYREEFIAYMRGWED